MKTITILLAVVLTLGSVVPSVSQSNQGKKLGIIEDEGINKDEIINTANEFRPGTVFAVDIFNQLLHFDVTTPGRIDGTVPITNLQPGENILGIDFRPATGSLYGLGSTSQLYVINLLTGFASPVGGPFSPALVGVAVGFDFNPTADRIRVVSSVGQNLRLNPDTGAVAANDTPTPTGMAGSAYTNNFAGATTTTLYGINFNTDQLVIQNPPNDGVVSPVGSLGFDTGSLVGFDIQAGSNIAYASLTTPAALSSHFFSVNLATGAATLVGEIAASNIRGIAVVSGPETIFAVTTSNNLIRFDSNTPGQIVSATPILGLQPGENILGIDFRPATGELYGLGSTSRIYKINTANGQATAVGSGPFSPALNGTDFGFDFNPTVDRIRVVSDAEQNFRLHPDTGVLVVLDPDLNPPGNVVAAAYTNNFAGATSTTLYDIDSTSDLLLTQNPPNNGVLNAVGPLNVNTSGLTGFDIARNGLAYASLTAPAASSSSLYTVNLATGAASLIGTIGGGELIRDLAIRLTTEVVYGVVTAAGPTNNLITFNAATPNIIISTVPITGLQAGELILGMDFRPATGGLYALGSTSRLYTINVSTGVATAVGPVLSTTLNGTSFGFDFNPTVDRIRVVSDNEQNIAINPNTAAVTVNGALNPAGNVVAAAYSNNFAGATSTTLYDIDSASDQLYTQVPATGTLSPVGVGLGVNISLSPVGFDIAPGSGTAYVSAYTGGASPGLYALNLGAGTLTLIGTVNAADTLQAIAIQVSGTPIAGIDSPGVYTPFSGTWFLRNSNSAGPADTTFVFGPGGALLPIKGDWDGDGDDTAGVYDPSTGAFFLRNTNASGPADIVFTFGGPGMIPVSGDWDGDGRDSIGVYNSATGAFFLKNTNSGGAADITFTFGAPGAVPITGDWNGDNIDTIGIYFSGTGTFFLRNSNTNGPADVSPFTFGAPGATPLAGDWNGDGVDTIGVYQSSTGAWFISNGFPGTVDAFGYGTPGQTPLVGDWDGL